MRVVEDEAGRRYRLEKRSGESSRVRDLESGESRRLPNEELSPVDGVDPLVAVAGSIPGPARRLVSAVHDERALGLLVLLGRAPRSVRALLDDTELCESDLLGIVSELRAADLVVETTVDGERGYAPTEDARAVIEALQSEVASSPETVD